MTSLTLAAGAAGVDAVVEVLAGQGVELDRPTSLRRTRLDTFDGALARGGLQLEHRRVLDATTDTDGTATLVLTAPSGPPAHLALATEVPRDPVLDLADLPPGPFRTRLAEVVGVRRLLALVEVDSRRRSGVLTSDTGRPLAEVHLDLDVHVAPGPHAHRTGAAPSDGAEARSALGPLVVEVAALAGGEKPAARLVRRIDDEGTRALDGDLLRAAAVAVGVAPDGWPGPVAPRLRRKDPALVGYRAVLRSVADALDATWEGTAAHLDSEFLHDLRIAVRRTRSVLTEGRKVLTAELRRDQRAAFAWLGQLTGPARDLDVYVEGWDALVAPLDTAQADALAPVRARLRQERADAHAEVTAGLRSRRAEVVRTTWRAWLELPDDEVGGGKLASARLGRIVADRIADAQRGLVDDGRAIGPDSPPTELHQLRKDGKRLRYLLESFGSLGGEERSREVVRHLKRLQDNLGEFQDTEVQADRLRATVAGLGRDGSVDPATAQAVEVLAAHLGARQAAARDEFADRFAEYDRKAVRRVVRELTERMAR